MSISTLDNLHVHTTVAPVRATAISCDQGIHAYDRTFGAHVIRLHPFINYVLANSSLIQRTHRQCLSDPFLKGAGDKARSYYRPVAWSRHIWTLPHTPIWPLPCWGVRNVLW